MVNAVEVVDGIYNISTLGHSSNLWEEYIQRHLINLDNILKHFSYTAPMFEPMVALRPPSSLPQSPPPPDK